MASSQDPGCEVAPEDPGIKICPDKTLPDSDDGGDVSPPQREPELPIDVEKQLGVEPTYTATGEMHPYDTSAVAPEHRRETILPTTGGASSPEQPSAAEQQSSQPGTS